MALEPHENWRERLLQQAVWVTFLFGALVYVPSAYIAFSQRMWTVLIGDTAAFLGVFGLYMARRSPFALRAFLFNLILYFLGVVLLTHVGPISKIYLLGSSVFAALLMGRVAGYVSVLINSLTVLLLGLAGYAHPSIVLGDSGHGRLAWGVISLNFALVSFLLSEAINSVISSIQDTSAALSRSLRSLQEEIAERRAVQEHLTATEARFTELAQNVNEIFFVFDTEDSRLLYLSPAFSRITGLPAEPFLLSPGRLLEHLHSEDREPFQAAFLQARNAPVDGLYRFAGADGRTLRLQLRAYPVGSATSSGKRVVGTVKDVTDEVEQREAAAELTRKLEDSRKLETLGRLAGGVAHDFNNLLTVILGNAELLKENVENDPSGRGTLEEVIDAGNRSAALTRQLLAFARKQPTNPRRINLNATVSDMKIVLARMAGESITIDWSEPSEPIFVNLDPAQVTQILTNLIINARDAILAVRSTGTISVSITRIDTGNSPPQACLRVTDDGCGVPEEEVSSIFEPFYTTKPLGEGTGLGLATVYGIVHQNGGSISVESELNRGTSFSLYFPLIKPAI